jgi:hypothetical protein
MSTTLVCVVNGEVYEKFAEDLFTSARKFFHPTNEVRCEMFYGPPGWPDATMYRHHVLAKNMPNTSYVFLCDADMLFVAPVREEILPEFWVTATLHPGYVTTPRDHLPYERRPESSTCIPYGGGEFYFAGGFVGGTRHAMMTISRSIKDLVDRDHDNGIVPTWHDESALNRVLSAEPPEIALSPSYCYPANDTWYRNSCWPEQYERKLIALDKTEDQRAGR